MEGVPLPHEPVVNQNFCLNPTIILTNITYSNTTGDILEVNLNVQNDIYYNKPSKCYLSCSIPYDNGTTFTIYSLFINCTLISPNSTPKNAYLYAVLKMTLMRLIYDSDYDIKWLYRRNYDKFIESVKCSVYNQFIPILESAIMYEQYFK